MAFRVFLCVVLAFFGIWCTRYTGVLRQTDNTTETEESPAFACEGRIKTSEDILAYTKKCLRFPVKAIDCVRQYIEKREEDPVAIAIECTPDFPESLKHIQRKMLLIMKKTRDVECRCSKTEDSNECANELLGLKKKHVEAMESYIRKTEKLNGKAIEADRKFSLIYS